MTSLQILFNFSFLRLKYNVKRGTSTDMKKL